MGSPFENVGRSAFVRHIFVQTEEILEQCVAKPSTVWKIKRKISYSDTPDFATSIKTESVNK